MLRMFRKDERETEIDKCDKWLIRVYGFHHRMEN